MDFTGVIFGLVVAGVIGFIAFKFLQKKSPALAEQIEDKFDDIFGDLKKEYGDDVERFRDKLKELFNQIATKAGATIDTVKAELKDKIDELKK